MKNNTKIVLTILVLALIAIVIYFSNHEQAITETPLPVGDNTTVTEDCATSNTCTNNFVDAKNTVSFDYNKSFIAKDDTSAPTINWRQGAKNLGVMISSITIPKSYMPGTNFSDAHLTIGRSSNANEIKSCMTLAGNGETKDSSTTIDGNAFTKFSLEDAGAGNFYETTSYRGIVDGDCYAIEYTIHSTNIDNYPPEQGIVEFDKAKIQSELEKMVSSVKFLNNSK